MTEMEYVRYKLVLVVAPRVEDPDRHPWREDLALFVGEPSGGRSNHCREVRTFELPNLRRTAEYSTKYVNHYHPADGSDPPALWPDRGVAPSFPAYVQGRDPALEVLGIGGGTQ